MDTFLNQAIPAKELCLKKINKMKIKKIFLIFFLVQALSLNVKANTNEKKQAVVDYVGNIKEFSSKFIQTDGETIEEGNFYLKKNRLKIVYTFPSKIDLIIAKNKAMYFNKDLNEVEYFNPKKTMADVFFKVFNDPSFFTDFLIKSETNYIILEKVIGLDERQINVQLVFEDSPLVIRKININDENSKITYSIIDPNFNPNLDIKFFSMVNPNFN